MPFSLVNSWQLDIIMHVSDMRKRFILASKSPRRLYLLRSIVPEQRIVAIGSDIDEQPVAGEDAVSFCERTAQRKVHAVWSKYEGPRGSIAAVIGADTVIWFESRIIGQPENNADAMRTLTDLSGRVHEVITGVAVFTVSLVRMETIAVRSKVWMHEFDEKAIDDYI